MKRPKQLPAVDRNTTKSASVPVGVNVSPSAWTDFLQSPIMDFAPPLGGTGIF
jgi:hypothetical protein